jgi:GDP-L-fucose synthase
VRRVLITGSTGLLGSACVREFAKDHEILTPKNIDLINREGTREMFNAIEPIDIVIHCAAKVGGVKANKDNPVEFMLQNLWMQNNVIEAAHDAGVRRLCFIGTSCMFPRDADLPVQETSLFTGKLEDSVEAYAIAKIAGWRLCKAYWEQYGDRFITVAPSNIYGIGDNYGPEAHVIPALIKKYHEACLNETPMQVWGDGTAVREFIYSDDVASAIRVLINHWKSPEVVNIGTGIGTSIKELVADIAVTSPYGAMPKIEYDTTQPTGIPRKIFSIEKLKNLSWEPKYNLRTGLQIAWNDFLSGNARGI